MKYIEEDYDMKVETYVRFGSDFQKRVLVKSLWLFMKTWTEFANSGHKKNKARAVATGKKDVMKIIGELDKGGT
tara:strand:+ start:567 stop:788 length:222 start_codon:yes stop_codon:yes gene_type:complete